MASNETNTEFTQSHKFYGRSLDLYFWSKYEPVDG